MAFHAITEAIDYPMFVVTAAGGDTRAGCLVGFTTQCSIDPARYIVCLSDKNRTARVAAAAEVLAVHLLDRSQRPLAELFGGETGDDVDKFEQCHWEPAPGPEGTPLLTDCPNRFLGRVVARHPSGDHTAYVLEVIDASIGDGPLAPLTFQEVRDMGPGHTA